MRRRGHGEEAIRKVVYDNPLAFFRQCARWQEWSPEPAAVGHAAGTGNGNPAKAAVTPARA
jgi:hypothetical protein